MKLTEKGSNAIRKAIKYFLNQEFSAAELSNACGEKISAAALNGVVNQGLMTKKAGSPVKFALVEGVEEMLASEEAGGCDNTNLHAAKVVQNDEFYTRYEDIEKELMEYKKPRNQWRGKKIFCNCNDGLESNFVKFFIDNFEVLGIESLTAINYVEGGKATKYVVDGDRNEDGFIDIKDVAATELNGDGSFMSDESVEELKKCDIVVTNPPFSVFRDFVAVVRQYGKDFCVIGSKNAITYKEFFPLLKSGEVHIGETVPGEFISPDGSVTKKVNVLCRWFTTLRTRKSLEPLPLTATYYTDTNRREEYPKYDNYDAIEVSKCKDIPCDYDGVMGVPITFLSDYCPEQFEIIGQMANTHVDENNKGYPFIDGKRKYARVLIKRIQN